MRLWSLHPRYLDRAGLVAGWREALLAQAVVAGRTRGYRNHPQLERFLATENPEQAVAQYLSGLADESAARGYRFKRSKIGAQGNALAAIPVTTGQIQYEWQHLRAKLRERSPDTSNRFANTAHPDAHPLFRIVEGPVESWEKNVKSVRGA
jgi:hypothetical protein